MRRLIALFISAFSLAASSSPSTEVSPPETPLFQVEKPKECETNQPNIQFLRLAIVGKQAELLELTKKRSAEELTEEENKTLLFGEMQLTEFRMNLSVREFLEYYCLHPEKVKPTEITVQSGLST
jgi:hypothetical protein